MRFVVEIFRLFGFFLIKECVYYFWRSKVKLCNKNKRNIQFSTLINNSVTIGLSFLLLSISAIMSAKQLIFIKGFLFESYSSIFLKI